MKRVYAIYDRVAEEFAPPYVANNDAVALRAFKKDVPRELVASDYWLFFIGEYNEKTGILVGQKKPVRIEIVEEKIDG